MPRVLPDFFQIRANYLRDVQNLQPDADTGNDSDHFVRASATASCAEGLYTHQVWVERQIFPDTSDPEVLERHAATRGLTLKPAVAAAGILRVTGTTGGSVAAGQQLVAPDGRQYVTTAAADVDAGAEVEIPAAAVISGVAGNAAEGDPVSFVEALAGIAAAAVLTTMVGGTDKETHAELLARLLELLRRPPAGGNKYDFRRWAMEVPGVTNAFPYPLRRGLGTIDVAVVSGTSLPSAATLAAVQAHVDDVRPVTAKNFLAFAPTEFHVSIHVLVALDGVSFAAAELAINQSLAELFSELGPGDAFVRSQAEARISGIAGVVDRQLLQPAANVAPVVDAVVVQWLRLGEVTVGVLA